MDDYPWNKKTDVETSAEQYAKCHNLDLADTVKKFAEAKLKIIYETDPRLDPNFEGGED